MSLSLPSLVTERLIVNHLGLSDASGLADYYRRNHRHLSPTSPVLDHAIFTESHWAEKIAGAKAEFDLGSAVRWVLHLKVDPQRVVGTANLSQIFRGPFQACYLGYAIDQDEQGKGMMFEALQAIVGYAFGELNIHRIMANYLPDNARSARVLERLGFVKEGVAKNYLRIDGVWQDHVLTSLTNPNWRTDT